MQCTKTDLGDAHESIAGGFVKLACRLRLCCLVSLRIFIGGLDTHRLPISFAAAPRPLCSMFLTSRLAGSNMLTDEAFTLTQVACLPLRALPMSMTVKASPGLLQIMSRLQAASLTSVQQCT